MPVKWYQGALATGDLGLLTPHGRTAAAEHCLAWLPVVPRYLSFAAAK
jgi:hypothetical protein